MLHLRLISCTATKNYPISDTYSRDHEVTISRVTNHEQESVPAYHSRINAVRIAKRPQLCESFLALLTGIGSDR